MTKELPGKLIVFEGIDGTGKSTQLSLLGDYLQEQGFDVVMTREPTEGPYGQKIRKLYSNRKQASRDEELELFLADRQEHTDQLLLPALRQGKIVLCDRYYLSTAAYQGANGFDPSEIIRLNHFAPQPDIAFIFEVSLQTSLYRITQGRGEELNDFEQAESLQAVGEIFTQLDLPFIRRINAERNIEDIHNDVITTLHDVIAELLPDPMEQS
jgi:dTMP kinase